MTQRRAEGYFTHNHQKPLPMVPKHMEQHVFNSRSENACGRISQLKELKMATTWMLNHSRPSCEEVAGKKGREGEALQPKTMH